MNDMRKLMEAVKGLDPFGVPDSKDDLEKQLEVAAHICRNKFGLPLAADYIEHVLAADYDSLDKFRESITEEDPCWDNYKQIGMKKKGGKDVPNCVPEGVEEYTIEDADEIYGPLGEELNEAEYQGRKVELNKPMQGDVKKFKVYVKNDKGNVVKVNFGEKGAKIKKNNPERRKSFRARHNCDNPGPKWKARYWSCRKW
jgi:hypothetical protein